jgi:hypothetical protein
VAEWLPKEHEALNSNSGTAKKITNNTHKSTIWCEDRYKNKSLKYNELITKPSQVTAVKKKDQ